MRLVNYCLFSQISCFTVKTFEVNEQFEATQTFISESTFILLVTGFAIILPLIYREFTKKSESNLILTKHRRTLLQFKMQIVRDCK